MECSARADLRRGIGLVGIGFQTREATPFTGVPCRDRTPEKETP
jgi:hypothetical protein